MSKIAYVCKRNVKTVGLYYPIGTILTDEEFNDCSKMRRGKIKVSEGKIAAINASDLNWDKKAQALEARLGINGIAQKIKDVLFPPIPEKVEKEEPLEPIKPAEKEEPIQTVKPAKVAPKAVTLSKPEPKQVLVKK